MSVREQLEQALRALDGVEIGPYKDTALICVNFNTREIAHFQAEAVLDLRLTPKIIKREALPLATTAHHHPKRSKNSRWICLKVPDDVDVETLVRLTREACTLA